MKCHENENHLIGITSSFKLKYFMQMKRISLLMLSAAMLMVSCKKDDASSKIDNATGEIAPADPNAVNPEPKLAAPEVNTNPAPKPVDGKYPQMSLYEKEFNFGSINQGDKVEHTFTFKNTGEADLIISDARASCGCTVPEYPKTAIKPGKTGDIRVKFNSEGKRGQTLKTVTISCNTATGSEILKIKTNIKVSE